jgi:hypothetical protein
MFWRVSGVHSRFTKRPSNVHPRAALKAAGPVPGGFQCAPDQKSAEVLFRDLTINGAVVWADGEGK